MKFVFLLVLVLAAQNADSQLFTPNITNLIIGILGNNSTTLEDILFFDVIQSVLSSYGFTNLTSEVGALKEIIGSYNQLEYAITELASMDDECSRQLVMFGTSLVKLDEWALKMMDATAKIQSGILAGNIMQVGNYDECLNVRANINGSQINGQYCTTYFTYGTERPINIEEIASTTTFKNSYGLCLPAVCNITSLERTASLLEQSIKSPYHLNFMDQLCTSTIKIKTYSIMSIVSIFIFTTVGGIIVFSTLYDIFIYQKQKHEDLSLLIAFSFYTNGRKLFSTRKSADSLDCLNGLRVISIMWIISCHRYLYMVSLPFINLLDVMEWPSSKVSAFITAGNMAVDTFFVISGLLVVYVYLVHKEKGQTVSFGMFYIHRILRLTPALAAMVLLYSTLLDHIGSGPFWFAVPDILQGFCEEYWWSTLLYIQNYVNPTKMCINHSWFLAVDTQLYFLSPLLLLPLIKWPKRTIIGVGCLIVTSSAIIFAITWYKNLPQAYFGLDDLLLKHLYAPTHVRAPAWLIGSILGYILFKIRNKEIKIKTCAKILLWFVSLGLMVAVIAYHSRMGETLGTNVSRLESAFANSLLRPLWAVGLSILIWLCVKGYGGIVNRLLSGSIFTILIRINYSVYLIHLLVTLFSLGQQQTPLYASHLNNFYYFWGDFVISVLLGIVWTLAFESPILVIEKIMFATRRPPKPSVINNSLTAYNNISVVVIKNKLADAGSQHGSNPTA